MGRRKRERCVALSVDLRRWKEWETGAAVFFFIIIYLKDVSREFDELRDNTSCLRQGRERKGGGEAKGRWLS